jgi:hypothetical protein
LIAGGFNILQPVALFIYEQAFNLKHSGMKKYFSYEGKIKML